MGNNNLKAEDKKMWYLTQMLQKISCPIAFENIKRSIGNHPQHTPKG